jgi:hypothetical protein
VEKFHESPALNPLPETVMVDYLKSQIKFSEDVEVIGVECLKCGSKRNIVAYYHSERISSTFFESRRTTRITTKGIKVPLCSSCNQQLEFWKNKHSTERNALQDTVICFIILIGAIVILSIFYPWAVFIPILIMVLGFAYIGYQRSKKNQPNSPFRYIKFGVSKTYVRPKGVGPWIKYDDWLHSI